MTTIFAYHRVPENFIGTTIQPLSRLKINLPELYSQNLQKYKGRESLFDVTLDNFNNVKFGEFSNFLLTDPQLWINNVKKYELLPGDKTFEFYKIPLTDFDTNATRVFRYTEDYTSPFNPLETLEEYLDKPITKLPNCTEKYYKEISKTQERLVFYHLLPHLITTQDVNIKNCEIIKIS